jgi:hypothetical protein
MLIVDGNHLNSLAGFRDRATSLNWHDLQSGERFAKLRSEAAQPNRSAGTRKHKAK